MRVKRLWGMLPLLCGVFLLPALSVRSQPKAPEQPDPSDPLVEIQDGVTINPTGETGIVYPADEFWASYSFFHLYDSCQVIYQFVELVQGSSRIELANWNYQGYEKTKTASELSEISRSKNFVVNGQPISYCHVVEWKDPRPEQGEQFVNNFYCEDTLVYTVSAVNEKTGERVNVETLTVMSKDDHILTAGGRPIAVVEWVPPRSWKGVNAYIDINLEVFGGGLSNPGRRDDITGRGSTALTEPFYSGYFRQFNEPYVVNGKGEIE